MAGSTVQENQPVRGTGLLCGTPIPLGSKLNLAYTHVHLYIKALVIPEGR